MRYFFLFLLFLVLVTSASAEGNGPEELPPTAVSHPDFDALMALYISTDGNNWNDKTGWIEGFVGVNCDVCSWYGVVCDQSGRVAELFLQDNNLTGALPAEIGDLTELIRIEFSRNNLNGSLPQEVGQLSKMLFFVVSENNLTGPVPDLSAMVDLRGLTLRDNQFTGAFPTGIAQNINISGLSLNNNNFSGPVPDLSGVRPFNFNLSNNNFSGALPNLGSSANVEILDLANNNFSGPIPESYNPSNFPELEGIYISGNNLTGHLPLNWGGFTKMLGVDLSDNQLSGPLPSNWADMPQLRIIFLENNNLESCWPSSWSAFCSRPASLFRFEGNPGLPDGGNTLHFSFGFCSNDGPQCTQDCPTSDVTLKSTLELQIFDDAWPSCVNLPGSLTIDGPVASLGRLNGLREVEGTLTIRNYTDTKLRGFNLVEKVGGLVVEDCANLENLERSVFFFLRLDEINGRLVLKDLPSFTDASELEDVEIIDSILIERTALTTLEPFRGAGGLTFLEVNENNSFTSLFEDVAGRGGLNDFVLDELIITLNNGLTTLVGLPVAEVTSNILIAENPDLATCNINAVCSALDGNTATAFFGDNLGNCQDTPDVEVACGILPVSWLDFTAIARQKTVDLSWSTAEKSDNAGFTAQRSEDGRAWTDLGNIAPANAGADGLYHYEWTDNDPPAGELLYRLKQTDFDGAIEYSVVRTVTVAEQGVSVFPTRPGRRSVSSRSRSRT